MRSIGKRNIALVKKIIKEEYIKIDRNLGGWSNALYETVMPLIPSEVFDTWEMGVQEIDRIFDDTLVELEKSL